MSEAEILASFVRDAPPGELAQVRADIESLVEGNVQLSRSLDGPAAEYARDKATIVRLPGGGQAIVSKYNQLDNDRLESGKVGFHDNGAAYVYDASSGKVTEGTGSGPQDTSSIGAATLETALKAYVSQHYPAKSAVGVYAQSSGDVAVVIVDTKYSPNNFWNGSWTSHYVVKGSGAITGHTEVDIHYFEDGNVRLKSNKEQQIQVSGGASAASVVNAISALEKEYQLEINTTFVGLNSGPFKSLRRQLPVNRSRMNWESFSQYRVGKTIGGE